MPDDQHINLQNLFPVPDEKELQHRIEVAGRRLGPVAGAATAREFDDIKAGKLGEAMKEQFNVTAAGLQHAMTHPLDSIEAAWDELTAPNKRTSPQAEPSNSRGK